MYIKQGDQYSLPIPLRLGNESVKASQVQKIELVICNSVICIPETWDSQMALLICP